MAEWETLLTDQRDGVLWIRLNRPKANAFNQKMIDDLLNALKQAERDSKVRCLVLTGEGKLFSAGQDVGALGGGDDGEVSFRAHLAKTYNRLIPRMRALQKPIVGAINGPAAGAGLGVALATDIRIAAQSARFVFGFTGIGLTSDSATSLMLPLLVGLARASQMAFTNDPLSAEQALAYGMVNQVVPDDELEAATSELALRLAQGPTRAIGLTKRAFNRAHLNDLESVLDYEAHLQEIAGQTADHREGLTAFQEKRPPSFGGS
ncbi:MAG TPA: enoyl-CoA hydratase-related protein [Anaerolineales bacterium]|jgi:2-(1,2-epoxy-1,2-dihydrophenyl)acetyl-CoA isomerase